MESLENIDPNDPWIIDENGKHTNVAAVCDWPDYDSDDDDSSNPLLSSLLGMNSYSSVRIVILIIILMYDLL